MATPLADVVQASSRPSSAAPRPFSSWVRSVSVSPTVIEMAEAGDIWSDATTSGPTPSSQPDRMGRKTATALNTRRTMRAPDLSTNSCENFMYCAIVDVGESVACAHAHADDI